MKQALTLLLFCFSTAFLSAQTSAALKELDSLANYWQGMGKYDKALLYANKAIALGKKEEADSTDKRLLRLALIYSDMNEFVKGEAVFQEITNNLRQKKLTNTERYIYALEYWAMMHLQENKGEEAEKLLDEAWELCKSIFGEKSVRAAEIQLTMGDNFYQRAEYDKALACYQFGLDVFGKDIEANIENYIVLLGNLGVVYSEKGEFEKAEPYVKKAVELNIQYKGKKHGYINTINSLAYLYCDMGLYEPAEALWLEALEIGRKEDILGPKHIMVGDFLVNLSSLYISMKRFSEAESMLKEAIQIYEAELGKNHVSTATAFNNLGVIYRALDRDKEAEAFINNSLEITAAILGKEHPNYASLLINMASYLEKKGDYKKAESYLKQVIDIDIKTLGKEHPKYAESLLALGDLYRKTKQYENAEKTIRTAASVFEKNLGTEHPSSAEALNAIATLKLDQQQLDSAKYYCLAAFAANSPSNAIVIDSLADLKYYSEAVSVEFFNTLIDICKATDGAEAFAVAEQALRYGNRIKNSFSAAENKLFLLNNTHNFATKGIETAVSLAKNASLIDAQEAYYKKAFHFAEQHKSALLADATKAQRARNLSDLPDSLALKEQAMQKQMDALRKAVLSTKEEEQKELIVQINDLNRTMDEFRKRLEQKYPKYYRMKYAEISASAEEVQQLLKPQSIFLEYFVADSALFLFVVEKGKLDLIPLGISAKELKSRIANLRSALSDYEALKTTPDSMYVLFCHNAHWFYKNLLAPALNGKKDVKHLTIVADGELGHLPFEVFLTEEIKTQKEYSELPYLLRHYNISYNYSATLWKENLSNKSASKLKNNRILGIAASYKGKEDKLRTRANRAPHLRNLRDALQDLPAAKEEVNMLAKHFAGDFWTDMASNEKAFKEKAGEYNIIHLAMHGLLNERAPILSSLAFTENGDSTEDNFLEAWEIAHLNLNAELVVLSACETGYGKFQQGEGVMSLARSFMYAGVPSVVVSLWQVNDASTALIMQLFYKNLSKGMSKSEALRQAKLEYMNAVRSNHDSTVPHDSTLPQHPAFWAAFIIIGDDRPIEVGTRSNGLPLVWIIGGLAGLAAIIGIFLMRRKAKEA